MTAFEARNSQIRDLFAKLEANADAFDALSELTTQFFGLLRERDDLLAENQRLRALSDPVTPTAPTPSPDPPHDESDSDAVDCDAGRHDPREIRAGTAPQPLGYFCAICRARCDQNGLGL